MFRDFIAGHLIATFIFRVSRMALHPNPFRLVFLRQFVQNDPQKPSGTGELRFPSYSLAKGDKRLRTKRSMEVEDSLPMACVR
jgi:hypothetical protein